jgi:hypothetical protein
METTNKPVDFFEEPTPVLEKHKAALARMYADPDIREYLETTMRVANQNAMVMLEGQKVIEAQAYAARYKSIKQLYLKAREYFIHYEKLRLAKEPLRNVK